MFANFQSFLDKPVDLDYVFNNSSKHESFEMDEAAPAGDGHGESSSVSQRVLAMPSGDQNQTLDLSRNSRTKYMKKDADLSHQQSTIERADLERLKHSHTASMEYDDSKEVRHIRNYESSINKIFAQMQTNSNMSQSVISKKSAAVGQSGDNLQQSFVQLMNEMVQQSIDPNIHAQQNVVSLEISPRRDEGKDSFQVSPDVQSSKQYTPHLNDSLEQNSQPSQGNHIVISNQYKLNASNDSHRTPARENSNQMEKKSSSKAHSRKSEQKYGNYHTSEHKHQAMAHQENKITEQESTQNHQRHISFSQAQQSHTQSQNQSMVDNDQPNTSIRQTQLSKHSQSRHSQILDQIIPQRPSEVSNSMELEHDYFLPQKDASSHHQVYQSEMENAEAERRGHDLARGSNLGDELQRAEETLSNMLKQKDRSEREFKTKSHSNKSEKRPAASGNHNDEHHEANNDNAQFQNTLVADDRQLRYGAQAEHLHLELQQSLSELLSNDNHSKQDEQNQTQNSLLQLSDSQMNTQYKSKSKKNNFNQKSNEVNEVESQSRSRSKSHTKSKSNFNATTPQQLISQIQLSNVDPSPLFQEQMELDVNKTMHMVTKPPSTNFEIEDILRNDISKASGQASRHSPSNAYQDYHTGGSVEGNTDHMQSQSKSARRKQAQLSNPTSKSSKVVVDRNSNDKSKRSSSRSAKIERKESNDAEQRKEVLPFKHSFQRQKEANSIQMIQAYQDRFAKEKQAPTEGKKENDRSKSREAAQNKFFTEQMKWQEQREKKIQVAQRIKDDEVELLRSKANNPLGKRNAKVSTPANYVSVVHQYEKSVKEYQENRKWREEMNPDNKPLDKEVYTFRPKIGTKTKILSTESEYYDHTMLVEDRLLERGRLAEQSKQEKQRQQEQSFKKQTQERAQRYFSKTSEQYLMESSDFRLNLRAGSTQPLGGGIRDSNKPSKSRNDESNELMNPRNSNGYTCGRTSETVRAQEQSVQVEDGGEYGLNLQHNLNQSNESLSRSLQSELIKSASEITDSKNTTSRANTSSKRLQIKTTLNQTYLYDQAKFQQEIKTQRAKQYQEEEAKKVQDKPKILKKSQRLAEGVIQKNANVHNRLYQATRKKDEEEKPTKSPRELKKIQKDQQEFIERNYREQEMMKEYKRQQIEKAKEKELQSLFKPQISHMSRRIVQERCNPLPTFEELYREAKMIKEKRELMQNQKQKEKEAKEMANATFKPKINSRSKEITESQAMTSTAKINNEVELFVNNDLKSFYTPTTQAKDEVPNSYSYLNQMQKLQKNSQSNTIKCNVESNATNSASKQSSSYLDMHLQKKNFEFNRIKQLQEERKNAQQNEMAQMSKRLLSQLNEQKAAIEVDNANESTMPQKQDDHEQFSIIENFLKTLAIHSPKREGFEFDSKEQKDNIDLSRVTKINFTPIPETKSDENTGELTQTIEKSQNQTVDKVDVLINEMESAIYQPTKRIMNENNNSLQEYQSKASKNSYNSDNHSVHRLHQKQSSIELINEAEQVRNIFEAAAGQQQHQQVELNKEDFKQINQMQPMFNHQDEKTFFKSQQNASSGNYLSSGNSAAEAKILEEARQAIQDFEKFSVQNSLVNLGNNKHDINIDQSSSQQQIGREFDNVQSNSFLNQNAQEQHSQSFNIEGHARKASNLIIEDEQFVQDQPVSTPMDQNLQHIDLQTPNIHPKQQDQSNMVKTSNQKGSQMPSSQNSMLDQRYQKMMDGTDGKMKLSENLGDSVGRTPDTDLRREFRYSEKNLEMSDDTPDVIKSKMAKSADREASTHPNLDGKDDGMQQPEKRNGQAEVLDYDAMIQIESPSPHKQEKFKNLQPSSKSRSTTKEYTNANQKNEIVMNGAKTDVVRFFDSLPEKQQEQQPVVIEPFGIKADEESEAHQSNHKKQSIKTNEIQIEENMLDDDEENKITPGGQTPKEDKSKSYKSISPVESGDKQYHTAENMPAKEKPQFQVNLQNVFKAESEKGGQDNNASHQEEVEGSHAKASPAHEWDMNENQDNKENSSQYPSDNKRINNSLSLIEEAECEDSLSLTQPISIKDRQSRMNKTGNIDLKSLDSSRSPINTNKTNNQDASAQDHYETLKDDCNPFRQTSQPLLENEMVEADLDPDCPQLAKDIILMEKTFISFLSQIYD